MEGEPEFDYVFDFTGEILHNRTEMVCCCNLIIVYLPYWVPQIQISSTCNVARMLGTEAAKRKVKAYVRIQQPFYECPSKGSHSEKEDLKPVGTLGIWWHESLRMLAAIEKCVIRLFLCSLRLTIEQP